jgi:hypothetical protein
MAGTKKRYDRGKSVRRLARQRIGTVPASRPMEPRTRRTRPKHKRPATEEDDACR